MPDQAPQKPAVEPMRRLSPGAMGIVPVNPISRMTFKQRMEAACRAYVEDPDKPTIGGIADKYDLDYQKVAQVSIRCGWDTMRINREVSVSIAESESRVERAMRVDSLVLTHAEKLADEAFKEFESLLASLRAQPLGLEVVESDSPPSERRTVESRNRDRINDRIMSLKMLTKSSAELAIAMRELGLVVIIPAATDEKGGPGGSGAGTAVQIGQMNAALAKAKAEINITPRPATPVARPAASPAPIPNIAINIVA